MSLLEPAARALAKSLSGSDDWDGLDEDLQVDLLTDVRTILTALRVPPPEVARAGEKLLGDERGHSISDWDMRDAWTVMIDALLNEGARA